MIIQDIAWNIDEHRALTARHGTTQGIVQDFGNAVGFVYLDRQLGDWLKHTEQVEFLEGVLVIMPERRPTGNSHHWRMPNVGRGNAGEQIRCPRATGDQTHRWCASDAR